MIHSSATALLTQLESRGVSESSPAGAMEKIRKSASLSDALSAVLVSKNFCPTPHIFSALLQKEASFADKRRLFSIISNKDAFHYMEYIRSKEVPLVEAQRALEAAEAEGVVDGTLYCGFIKRAGECGNFESVERIFQRALVKYPKRESSERRDVNNERCRIYNVFIHAAAFLKRFDAAESAFQRAYREQVADSYTYTTFAVAAWRAGREQLAEDIVRGGEEKKFDMSKAYQYVSSRRKPSEVEVKPIGGGTELAIGLSTDALLSRLELQRGKKEMRGEMCQGLLEAIKDVSDLNRALRIVLGGSYGEFYPSRHAFSALLQKEASRAEKMRLFSIIPDKDIVHYTRYIRSKEISFTEAERAFWEADEKGIVDGIAYGGFMKRAGECGEFEAMQKAFQRALIQYPRRERTANEERLKIYNIFIDMAATVKQLNAAHAAFLQVIGENIADSFTYSTFIASAAREGKLELAKWALTDAKRNGLANSVVHNSFLLGARNCEGFGNIESYLSNAIDGGLADAHTYNIALDAIRKKVDFAAATRIFDIAVTNKVADKVTYATYIHIAAKLGHWDVAVATLRKAIQLDCDDAFTYNNLIANATHTGQFPDVDGSFRVACSRGVADVVTYTSFVQVAGRLGHFAAATERFAEGIEKWPKDIQLYNVFLVACGLSENYQAAEKVFERAVSEAVADTQLYTLFIGTMGKSEGQLGASKKAFDTIYEKGTAGPLTYAALIDAAGRGGDFEMAKEIFAKSLQTKRADENCYGAWIIAIGKKEGLQAAQKAFDEVPKEILKGSVVYIALMSIAIERRDLPFAEQVFELGIKKGHASGIAYNMLLRALGEAKRDFSVIEALFQGAVREGVADLITYTTFIAIAGLTAQFLSAKNAFDTACAREIEDPQLYTSILDVASKTGEFIIAEKIFVAATQKGYRDMKMRHVYIDCLVRQKRDKEAEELFPSCKFPLIFSEEDGKPLFDLHGYSHGSGFIALKFLKIRCEKQGISKFTVITGKGNEADGNYLTFGRDLATLIESRYGGDLSIELSKRNFGQMICTINSHSETIA